MWNKLISQHEKIIMTFSGHAPCANVVMRQDKGVHGNTVSQFLVDVQTMDKTYNYETGMVAMLYFSEDGKNGVDGKSAAVLLPTALAAASLALNAILIIAYVISIRKKARAKTE